MRKMIARAMALLFPAAPLHPFIDEEFMMTAERAGFHTDEMIPSAGERVAFHAACATVGPAHFTRFRFVTGCFPHTSNSTPCRINS